MGPLILPTSGRVYIDAQIIIYTVDKEPNFWPRLQPLWQAVQSGSIELVTSELTMLECLVIPLRHQNTTREAAYHTYFNGQTVQFFPIDRTILFEAAQLRASIQRLRTPDSLHVATAIGAGCTTLLTNDACLRQIPGISTTYLGDITP